MPQLLKPITPEDGVDTEDLRGTLSLVLDFMSNEIVRRTYTHAPVVLRGRQPVNDSFLRGARGSTNSIRDTLAEQENLDFVDVDARRLKRELKEALERTTRKEHAFLTVPEQTDLEYIVGIIAERLSRLDKNYELKVATNRAQVAAANAEESASKASNAAGVTADSVLSTFYDHLGNEELETANTFRKWAITLGIMSGGIACLFMFAEGMGSLWFVLEPEDYVHLIQRGLVLAAFLALATYLAKQSHQHRTMSNWARSLAVQLKTFDAYLEAVDEMKVRAQLRQNFAIRVFGNHPAVKGEPAFTASSQGVAALSETVSKLLSAAK